MNMAPVNNRRLYFITHALYLVFFASLVFSLRAISSISIAAILLTNILMGAITRSLPFQNKHRLYFVAGCTSLFLLQIIAMLHTNDISEGWNSARIKTGLLITPLAVYVSRFLNSDLQQKLFFQYCLLLSAASLFCLGIAIFNYSDTGNATVFFYHALVKPISQHAIYFSLLVLFGLIFLLEAIKKNHAIYSPLLYIILIAYLSIILLLLSSKLVISIYLVYLFSFFLGMLEKSRISRTIKTGLFTLVILALILVFGVRNPISKRFYEIARGNVNVMKQEKFKPSDYFNGLQFRLLQWELVPEILTEKNRWWIGVSPGDAQAHLNEKYLSRNMYSGDPAKGTRGYLAYNTHNQFLQTTLQTGIIGLLILIAGCFCMLKMALKRNNRLTIAIVLVLLAWLFTEAPFETQYGIIIFTFFPMFLTAADMFSKTLDSHLPER